MKRLYWGLLATLLVCPVFGQNTLTICQKDGQQFSFGFEDKPVISYTDNDLVLKTAKTEIQYPLSSLSKILFTDTETSSAPIKMDKADVQLLLDNYVVSITGAKAGVNVTLTGSDGKAVGTYKTDSEGSVTFSIADLSQGLYIIKSDDLTCKILKK